MRGIGESLGGMDNPIFANLFIYEWPFFCFGFTQVTGINGYYFRTNGAYINADIPVACSDGSTPVIHVEARWDTRGNPNVEVSTSTLKDPITGWSITQTTKVITPTVADVTLDINTNLIGPIPELSSSHVELLESRGVIPRPDISPIP